MKKLRAYLIGYEHPDLPQSQEERTRMMKSCDVCIMHDRLMRTGEVIRVAETIIPGSGTESVRDGTVWRVAYTEWFGKVAVLELLPAS